MRKKQLQKILKYDIQTGIFYNLKSKNVTGKTDKDGFVWVWINKNKYRADKLAWLYVHGSWPKYDIIHVDGVNHHNWISNLKKPLKLKRKDNKSGVTGVYWSEKDKRWRSQILINNKQKSLGSYKNFDKAVLVRLKAEQNLNLDSGSLAQRYIQKMFL